MKKTIYLAGDSTCAYNDITTYPQTGWGQVLPLYVSESVSVVNYAANGRSSRSFIVEGKLAEIEKHIQKGDILCIQFGHNDQKDDQHRATEAFTTYKEYLTQYIQVARNKGATPVLLTSVSRRYFEDGKIDPKVHGDFPVAMKELAQEEQVVCIDIFQITRDWLQELGDVASRAYFMHLKKGEYVAYPEGLVDDTHLVYQGAIAVAGFVHQGLTQLGLL